MKVLWLFIFSICIVFLAFTPQQAEKYSLKVVQIGAPKYLDSSRTSKTLKLMTTLTNNTNDTLKYFNMSCSTSEIYKADARFVRVNSEICNKNIPVLLKLLPHESSTMEILVDVDLTYNFKTSFQIGIDLIHVKNWMDVEEVFGKFPNRDISKLIKKETVWSNKIDG